MRPHLLRTGLTMLFISTLALSCREDLPTEAATSESPYRETIEDYFSHVTSETSTEASELHELRKAIDFTRVERYTLTDNEDILIADVGKFGFEDDKTLKALFFIQQGEIVRSNLVSFSDANADHNRIILSIANRRFDPGSYTGRISYYNLYRHILFFNEMDEGHLTSSGLAQPRKNGKGKDGSRTAGCTDWYLITTIRYVGGGTSTTEKYLFTSCEECQSWRMQGRTNCGGGGGAGPGSYTPALPTYPRNGDRYVFTDPDGKTTTYIYNQTSAAWSVYLVVLPTTIIQSQPAAYPHLTSDGPPSHNTTASGPEGFLYIYDAWTATWEGGQDFEVGGDHPVSVITNPGAYFRCFNSSSSATLTIYVDQPLPGSSAPISGTDVGHAWLSLSQTVGGTEMTRVFGYYPEDGASPMHPTQPGVLVNDSWHEYDVSVTVTIPGGAVRALVNYLNSQLPGTYDLNSFNCTDAVVDACRAAGVTLPETAGSWLGGGGLCPGQLGEDLRTYDIPRMTETKNTAGGFAPGDTGICR